MPSCGNQTPGPRDDSWKGAEDGDCHCHKNISDIFISGFLLGKPYLNNIYQVVALQ